MRVRVSARACVRVCARVCARACERVCERVCARAWKRVCQRLYVLIWFLFCSYFVLILVLFLSFLSLDVFIKRRVTGCQHTICMNLHMPIHSSRFRVCVSGGGGVCLSFITNTHVFTFILHNDYDTPGKHYNSLFISLGPFGQPNT